MIPQASPQGSKAKEVSQAFTTWLNVAVFMCMTTLVAGRVGKGRITMGSNGNYVPSDMAVARYLARELQVSVTSLKKSQSPRVPPSPRVQSFNHVHVHDKLYRWVARPPTHAMTSVDANVVSLHTEAGGPIM